VSTDLYARSGRYYDLMYGDRDYGRAAERIHTLIRARAPHATTLLDVACGTGRHLAHLQAHYRVEGFDLSPALLGVARRRCPSVRFHLGDMVTMDLGTRFDVITCLFSAIAYVRTLARLRRAVSALARHLNPGGLLVVEPWFTPDSFWPDHAVANFHDEPDLKLAWMYVQRRKRRVSVLDIHFLAAEAKGVRHFVEHHELGLFTQDEHLETLRARGLNPEYDHEGLFRRGLYIATAPNPGSQ
jgi:SAM-dependent methyltransferase